MQKAVIRGVGQPLKIETCEVMDTPPGGARIHIQYAGVCHTDGLFIKSTLDIGDGNTFEFAKAVKNYKGCTVGHEISGIVEELGSKVDASKCHVQVGERVAVYPTLGCPSCSNCAAELYHTCLNTEQDVADHLGLGSLHGGGFATHVTVPDPKFLIPLPPSIPSDMGCMLACSSLSAYSALLKCRQAIHQAVSTAGVARLLLIGIGGLGLWGVRLAKATFHEYNIKLVIADISSDKLSVGLEAGADETILWNPGQEVKEAVAITTDNQKNRPNAVIDFVGTGFTSKVGLQSLAPMGMMVVVGLHGGSINMSVISLALGPIGIQGSKCGSVPELRSLVNLIDSHNITFPWTEKHRLDDVNDVLDRLRDGKITGRAILKI